MLKSWEEGKAEARAETRTEARTETRAEAVLDVLDVRGITVPDAARERILAQKDMEQPQRWLKKAALASSISEVLDDST